MTGRWNSSIWIPLIRHSKVETPNIQQLWMPSNFSTYCCQMTRRINFKSCRTVQIVVALCGVYFILSFFLKGEQFVWPPSIPHFSRPSISDGALDHILNETLGVNNEMMCSHALQYNDSWFLFCSFSIFMLLVWKNARISVTSWLWQPQSQALRLNGLTGFFQKTYSRKACLRYVSSQEFIKPCSRGWFTIQGYNLTTTQPTIIGCWRAHMNALNRYSRLII